MTGPPALPIARTVSLAQAPLDDGSLEAAAAAFGQSWPPEACWLAPVPPYREEAKSWASASSPYYLWWAYRDTPWHEEANALALAVDPLAVVKPFDWPPRRPSATPPRLNSRSPSPPCVRASSTTPSSPVHDGAARVIEAPATPPKPPSRPRTGPPRPGRPDTATSDAGGQGAARLAQLAEACGDRARGKVIWRMRHALRPFPQGIWVTSDGVEVRITASELVWPGGRRERLRVDQGNRTVQVGAATASTAARLGHLPDAAAVAAAEAGGDLALAEIRWADGDRWRMRPVEPQPVPEKDVAIAPKTARRRRRKPSPGEQGDDGRAMSQRPSRPPSAVGRNSFCSRKSISEPTTTRSTRALRIGGGRFGRGVSLHERLVARIKAAAEEPARQQSKRGTDGDSEEGSQNSDGRPERTEEDIFGDEDEEESTTPVVGIGGVKSVHSSPPKFSSDCSSCGRSKSKPSPSASLKPSKTGGNGSQRCLHAPLGVGDRWSRGTSSSARGGSPASSVSKKQLKRQTSNTKRSSNMPSWPCSGISDDLRRNLHLVNEDDNMLAKERERAARTWEVMQTAKELSMTAEEVREALQVFSKLDEDDTGTLGFEQFEGATMTLLRERRLKPMPSSPGSRSARCPSANNHDDSTSVARLCREHWASLQEGREGDVNHMTLKEFLVWFSKNRFRAEFFLTPEQRRLRGFAQRYAISESEVDFVSTSFQQALAPGKEAITLEEFGPLLRIIMRLPEDESLPRARIQFFWRELDADREANFEALLQWWIQRRTTLLPYESFYRNVRDLRRQQLDPLVGRSLTRQRASPAPDPAPPVPVMTWDEQTPP